MHILLILIVLMLAFPAFARLVGGVLKGFFWLVLVLLTIGLIGALSH
jgi:hypothetical protein